MTTTWQIARHSPLTAEVHQRRYLEEIKRFPLLEPGEEYMLAKRWREHGDPDAAHRLVTSHLRLVAKIAAGYRGYRLPMSEVVSEGNIGLMRAVKRFEPDKGFRFATYAIWWIKASIQEYILRSWSLVKLGTTVGQKRLFFNLEDQKKHLRTRFRRPAPRSGSDHRQTAGRDRARSGRDEPPSPWRCVTQLAAQRGRAFRRLAGQVGRR